MRHPPPVDRILMAVLTLLMLWGCTPQAPRPIRSTSSPAPTSTLAFQTPEASPSASPTPILTARPQPWMEGPIRIGLSAGGRPLEVFRFGLGESTRMIVAGIHGGYEWNTSALAQALIDHLSQNPSLIPEDVTLYILPVLNPDGAARGRDANARGNDREVDLNRNWPALWEPTGSAGACWHYAGLTAGEYPASEPEVRTLMAFILEHQVETLLNYHSAALGIFPGGQPPDSDSVRLAEAVSAVSPYPYPPIDLGCRYTGQLIDWASEQSIPSLDIELSTHSGIDWEINLRILRVFLIFE
ncbi:MAG: M14 family metallopeptidase [Anaerolineales bacterium]